MTFKENELKKMDSKVKIKQLLTICTVGLSFLVNSMTIGLAAPLLPLLTEDPEIDISDEEGSWIASIVTGGAILGSLISSYLLDWLGRKNLLFYSMLLYIYSWAQIALTYSGLVIIFARFVAGVCVGLVSSSGAVYLAETVHESFRSTLGVLMAIFGTFGAFLISVLVKFGNWRGLAWAGMIMCLPSTFSFLFLPASPFYLYYLSPLKAKRSLKWLFEDDSKVSEKFRELKVNSRKIDAVSISDLFRRENRRPSIVLMALHVFQQLTGINALIFYSTFVFEDVLKVGRGEFHTILLSLSNVVFNLVSSVLQIFCPRRFLFKLSTVMCAACLLAVSVILLTREYFGINSYSYVQNILVVAIYLYVFSFAVGWGPVPFLFMGEGLPSSIRGNATGKAVALNWAFAFLVTKYFKNLATLLGYGCVFLIFSLCTFVSGMIIGIYMPETFGKSLEQMESFYYNKKKEI